MEQDEPKVLFEHRGPVGHLVLNRPGKLNALDTECVDLIGRYAGEIEADDQVRGGGGVRAWPCFLRRC